ncbi:MAG: hypothetical protein H6840_06935 [Planctomycetes bacterium]|nr:hypothetical protein [Planctomycetota bacterium]
MDTTQSGKPRQALKTRQIAAGVVLSLGAFLFGGFMALPALIAVAPRLRRYWPFALALFVGVLGVRGLTLLGLNPVLAWARARAIEELGNALGGEVSLEGFSGDATSGSLHFEGVRVTLPEVGGEASLESVDIETGLFMLFRKGYVVTGRNLSLRVDASGGKLESYLSRIEAPNQTAASLLIEGGRIEVYGSPTSAVLTLKQLQADSGPAGWALSAGFSRAQLTLIGRTHDLSIVGGITVGDAGQGLVVQADLRAIDEEVGFGILRGELQPGGASSMTCVLDRVELHPLWARYRKVDNYEGLLRGQVRISGNLNRLAFGFDCEVQEFDYYHFTAMALDPAHSFKLPQARLTGTLVLLEGETWEFRQVAVEAADATLATGDALSARGGGKFTLEGTFPELSGTLDATVESGRLSEQISWSPLHSKGLNAVEPNIVLLAEQFPQLELDWKVEVKQLAVDCEPLTGTLSGSLSGTFHKQKDVRLGTLRAGGELAMTDGRVRCLGIDGQLSARLVFNPNAPTNHASLRGTLTAELGGTPINCEVTGDLQRPGFVFTGANLGPEALGRKIYRYSPVELTPAELLARREQCTRIFGPDAAMAENPLLAKSGGKVFFTVK